MSNRSLGALALLVLALALTPTRARAFCGFYVAGSEQALHNHATTVVLMREGERTVLSMQNDYAGPPEDFAMVVPVPVVLQRDDVRTLDRALFERVERLTGPRLVEYWEEDPCAGEGTIGLGNLGTIGRGAGFGSGQGYGAGGGGFVRVEAQFAVGEYDIVILGTNDSSALDTWLRQHRYHIPDGAAEALRPYVEAGMKFFVARVDVDRVRFQSGHAVLSPLRVHYDSPQLSLPVRLGLLNSAGAQDLVVVVLGRNQRYEMANYPNAYIPTNLDVADGVRERFGDFYESLLTRTLERHPGAVITEYSWQATSCDPCPPDATLDAQMLTTLGGDVLFRQGVQQGGFGIGGSWGRSRVSSTIPQVRADAPRASAGLAPEIIRRVTRRHINELRFCYEQSLASQPTAAGTITASYTIAAGTGTVSEASVQDDPSGSLPPTVAACVTNAFRRWTFPVPENGDVHVTQPVTFSNPGAAPPPPPPAEPTTPAPSEIAYEGDFVATRLHYRYDRSGLGEDLVFRAAPPIIGGREVRNEQGALEEGAVPSSDNNFQARYVIRHPWEGPIACESPVRGRWGARPGSQQGLGMGFGGSTGVSVPASVADAHPPPLAEGQTRTPLTLEPLVYTPVADLGLAGRDASTDAAGSTDAPGAATPPSAEVPPTALPANAPPPAASEDHGALCAIRHGGDRGRSLSLLALGLVLVTLARRRARR